MGPGKVLALICASLTLAPLAAAQSFPDAVIPRSPPTALLTVLRFGTVALQSNWGEEASDNGRGLIVARRGNDILVATAAHVVRNKAGTIADSVKVTLMVDGDGRTETREGRVEIEPAPGIPEGADLAFVSVAMDRRQPLIDRSMAASPVETGDLVWILGSVDGNDWSPTAGEIAPSTGDPQTIAFSGGGAVTGTSGSPLVAHSGVVGLVRESGAGSAYATPISVVREQFDRFHAGQWQWSAQTLPIFRRMGWVRLRRVDVLGSRLPTIIALTGASEFYYLTPDQWVGVPAGRYKVGPWTMAGIRSDVNCDLTLFDVKPWSQRDLPLLCKADPTGTWDLFDGRLIRIGPEVATTYPVTVLRQDGQVIGDGTGQIFDGATLRLILQDQDVGVSTIEVTLKESGGRGTISIPERSIDRTIQIFRKRE